MVLFWVSVCFCQGLLIRFGLFFRTLTMIVKMKLLFCWCSLTRGISICGTGFRCIAIGIVLGYPDSELLASSYYANQHLQPKTVRQKFYGFFICNLHIAFTLHYDALRLSKNCMYGVKYVVSRCLLRRSVGPLSGVRCNLFIHDTVPYNYSLRSCTSGRWIASACISLLHASVCCQFAPVAQRCSKLFCWYC